MDTRAWILVVDDDRLIRAALRRNVLARTGATVVACAGAEIAIAALEGAPSPPVAMILDGDLGAGGCGADVLRAARDLGVASPCAFFTGLDGSEIRDALRVRELDPRVPCFHKPELAPLLGWVERLTRGGG